jgi:hypothetical protein
MENWKELLKAIIKTVMLSMLILTRMDLESEESIIMKMGS